MMDADTDVGGITLEEPSSVRITIGCLMVIQTLVGLFGNTVILRMFCKFKQLRTPSNTLLIFLAMADIGMCFCITFSTASVFSKRWIFGLAACTLYGFSSMFFGLAVIGLLTCLSIDRYLVVCRRSFASTLTSRHYSYMSVAACINALFWAIVPVLGWASYAEDKSGGCAIDWTRRDASYISYLFVLFTACFVIPLSVMVFCFGRAHAVIVKRQKVHEATTTDSDLSPINADWANQKQVTQLGVVLVIIFLFTWSPFAIICLWGALGNPHNVPLWLVVLGPFAAKCSQFLNPMMFVIFIKKFRDYATVTVCCRSQGETLELAPPTLDPTAIEWDL